MKFKVGDTVVLQCECHKGKIGKVREVSQGGSCIVRLGRGTSITCIASDLRLYEPVAPVPQQAGHPRFYELLAEEGTLHGEKNTDYAKDGDALGNFKRVAAIKKLYPNFPWDTPTGTCIDYMLKQLDCAMWMLCKGYEGKVETFGKLMMDVSVYSNLAIINKEEEQNGTKS